MRPQDIKIGEAYRFKAHPNYGYAEALEVIDGKTGVNTNSYKVVKCKHTVNKSDEFGYLRHFRPCDLVKGE